MTHENLAADPLSFYARRDAEHDETIADADASARIEVSGHALPASLDEAGWTKANAIRDGIDKAYAAWENGEDVSPSPRDLVRIAVEITGRGLSESDLDLVSDEVDQRLIDGYDTIQVAIYLAERLS